MQAGVLAMWPWYTTGASIDQELQWETSRLEDGPHKCAFSNCSSLPYTNFPEHNTSKFIENKITKCKQIKLNVELYNDLAACMCAVIKLEILMTFVVSKISSKVKVWKNLNLTYR